MRSGLTEDEQAILATQAGVISWKEMHDSEKAQELLRAACKRINPESEELHAFMRDTEGAVKPRARSSGPMRSWPRSASRPPATVRAPRKSRRRRRPPPSSRFRVKEPPQKGNGKKKRAKSEEPTDAPREEQPEDLPPAPSKADEPAPESEPEVRAAQKPEPKSEKIDEPGKKPEVPVGDKPPSQRDEKIADDVKSAMDAAHKAESAGPDKGIEAWRKIVQAQSDAARRRVASCSACIRRPSGGTRSSSS